MIQKRIVLFLILVLLGGMVFLVSSLVNIYLLPKQYRGSLPVSFLVPVTWDVEDRTKDQEITIGTKSNPNQMTALIELHSHDTVRKSPEEILKNAVPHLFDYGAEDYFYLTVPHIVQHPQGEVVAAQVIYRGVILPFDTYEAELVVVSGEQKYALMIFLTHFHIEDFADEIELIVESFTFK